MHKRIRFISIKPGMMAESLSSEIDSTSSLFCLNGALCKNEIATLHHLKTLFRFPDYFGYNWDAVDECLCDLEWLSFTGLTILIDRFPHVFNGDPNFQTILLSCIDSMVKHWESKGICVDVWINLAEDLSLSTPTALHKWDRFLLRWKRTSCPFCGAELVKKPVILKFDEDTLRVDMETIHMLYPEQSFGSLLKTELFVCHNCYQYRYTPKQTRHIQKRQKARLSTQALLKELIELD